MCAPRLSRRYRGTSVLVSLYRNCLAAITISARDKRRHPSDVLEPSGDHHRWKAGGTSRSPGLGFWLRAHDIGIGDRHAARRLTRTIPIRATACTAMYIHVFFFFLSCWKRENSAVTNCKQRRQLWIYMLHMFRVFLRLLFFDFRFCFWIFIMNLYHASTDWAHSKLWSRGEYSSSVLRKEQKCTLILYGSTHLRDRSLIQRKFAPAFDGRCDPSVAESGSHWLCRPSLALTFLVVNKYCGFSRPFHSEWVVTDRDGYSRHRQRRSEGY